MKRPADQIALPLDWPQTDGDARFILSDANREAFEHFRKWSMWPVKATILTGPEGGFTDEERASIRAAPNAVAVSLGPRILRAETAALAALATYMAVAGDWRA